MTHYESELNRNEIINQLVAKFPIGNLELIEQYVDFCIENSYPNKIKYKTEAHHILPKNKNCFPAYKLSKWNIVNLSVKNHIIAHYKLFKAIPNHVMIASAMRVTGNSYNPKMVICENDVIVLAEYVEKSKQEFKQFMLSDKNPNRGSKRTPEQRKRLSEGMKNADRSNVPKRQWVTKGNYSEFVLCSELDKYISKGWEANKRSDDIGDKISKKNTGRKDSDIARQNKSIAAKKNAPNHHMKSEEQRKYRSKKFTENNPSQQPEFKEKMSIAMENRWKDQEYKIAMSTLISESNTGRIWYYNKTLCKFRRFKVNDDIPEGFIDATGKLGWKYDESGTRRKIYVETE